MKTKVRYLTILFIVTLFTFYSCDKNENPVDNNNLSGKGSDYFPITAGKVITAKVSGTATEYDSMGVVTEFKQITNEVHNGNFGATTFIRNMNANPFFGNDDGEMKLVGYLFNNNGEIIGFGDDDNNDIIIILPSELSVGKEWVVNPQNPINEQLKLKIIESKNSFTNSAGKTFSNTINISVVFKDSISKTETYFNYTKVKFEKVSIVGNIYIAKGVGIVGAKVVDFEAEEREYVYEFGLTRSSYKKMKATGEMGIID